MKNLNALAGTEVDRLEHPDTLASVLERLGVEDLAAVPRQMVYDLIRSRRLDAYRLYRHHLVAIDGSGHLSFAHPHCTFCLHQTHASGATRYYHEVLEAKLVTENGLALPLATAFIENSPPAASKQDCELKALQRLVPALKSAFPRLPLCLLLDALYANQSTLQLCRTNGWHFITTFKEGSLPTVWEEYVRLRDLSPQQHLHIERRDGTVQDFRWVEGLEHEGHRVNAVECVESKPGTPTTRFAWITDFPLNPQTVEVVANRGGRNRWKIENEGFNAQKNGGYRMEHAYSEHPVGAKNFYYLLQIAHLINQILEHSNLIPNPQRTFGSLQRFTAALLESLRGYLISAEVMDPSANRLGQVRLTSP